MNTENENMHGEDWSDPRGIYVSFNVKKLFNWMRGKMRIIISLLSLFILPYAWGADCFTPAHNMVGYSEDLTSATGWTKIATMADTTATSGIGAPPAVFNVGKTFSAVLAAGQSHVIYGSISNVALVSGQLYQFSIYAKYLDRRYIGLGITGGGTIGCSYDLLNGVVGVCTGLTNPTITAKGNGWYKLTALHTGSIGTYPNLRLHVTNQTDAASFTVLAATGGETFYLSSPQVQNVTTPPTDPFEVSKYVPNALFGISWAPAISCNVRAW